MTNSYPNSMKYLNRASCEPKDISDLFADYFKSVYKEPRTDYVRQVLPANDLRSRLFQLSFTESEVLYQLDKLNANKGAGPDEVPNIFIKSCSSHLAEPLSFLFNLSLSSGVFPDEFKVASVTPIFKSGDKSDVTNYRPISILNGFSKVLERLVHTVVYDHVSPFLNANQHGFVKKKRTITNLMTCLLTTCLNRLTTTCR